MNCFKTITHKYPHSVIENNNRKFNRRLAGKVLVPLSPFANFSNLSQLRLLLEILTSYKILAKTMSDKLRLFYHFNCPHPPTHLTQALRRELYITQTLTADKLGLGISLHSCASLRIRSCSALGRFYFSHRRD